MNEHALCGPNNSKSLASQQAGLTLIEVLVGLLVLSIGLLGVAALTIFGLQSVHSSLQSSTASVAALNAEEWLWEALGNGTLTSCGELGVAIGNASDSWFPSTPDANRLTLPNGRLSVSPDSCVLDDNSPFGCAIRAQLLVTWDEERFGGTQETFGYWVQAPCTSAEE